MLGAASSLSVCCHTTAMVLTQASFRNLRKVFSISKSTYINRQENSKETNHTRDLKWCKLNENPTLEN
jgi:hypothetical protein